MEKSLLGLISRYTNHIAKIISDTLDTDILIIDSNMKVIGRAFKYLDIYTEITMGSIISTVLLENRNVVVEDKTRLPGCRRCEQFRECKMSSFVGVPIRVENQVVGVLALILTRHRAKFLFESLSSTVSFLENFSIFLAGKIENETKAIGLKNRLKEIEAIMDKMFEAVIYTDFYGNIIHVNQRFCDILHFDTDLTGRNLKELFPYQLITDYFQYYEDLSNERLACENNEHLFHGVVSSKKIYFSDAEFRTLFYFRPQSDFVKRINISEQGSMVTLEWLKRYFSQQELETARVLAKTEYHLLIQSSDNDLNLLLAKAIFNDSKRNLHDLYVIYSDNLYRKLFEIYIMDEYGIFRNADNCTIVIMQPERMSFYVQNFLVNFMKTGKFPSHHNMIRSNVRFLFCIDQELEPLVDKELFSRELYGLIVQHKISFESMEKDKIKFRNFVTSGLDYYKNLYHNRVVELSEEVIAFFRKHYLEIGKHNVELILERIAAECTGKVTIKELVEKKLISQKEETFHELEDTAREQIVTMLEKGYSKSDIATILGISRSTLYRKIKAYDVE